MANPEMVFADDNNQPNDAIEIKQEIKEEPWDEPVELIEVPHLDYNEAQINCGNYSVDRSTVNGGIGVNWVRTEIQQQNGELISAKDARTEKGCGRINKNISNRSKNMVALRAVPAAHRCDICGYIAKCKSVLDTHSRKHTGEKPFACKCCDKHFTSKQTLMSHLKVHVDEFPFHCAVCLEGFDTETNKKLHEIKCSVRRYECHLCKASIGSKKTNLMIHMRTHISETPFECELCSEQFKTKLGFNGHMKSHSATLFHCSRCQEKFIRQNEKDAHEMECNRKVYTCYICGRSFGIIKSNLIKHMRIHTGETPFKCPHCNQQFNAKSSLTRHVKVHSKNEPFKCSVCYQGFPNESQRNVHQKNCNRRGYECFLCKKFFYSNKHNLMAHLRKHTGEKPFKCELCANGFTSKSYIKQHMERIHLVKY